MKFNLLTSSNWHEIMKITFSQLLIAFILAGMTFAKPTVGQAVLEKKVSLTIDNSRLSSALRELEKNADVKFVYSESIIRSDIHVSIQANHQTLGYVLNKLLLDNGISYDVFNKNRIVLGTLVSERANIEEARVSVSESDIVVTGKVTDSKGEALPGVSVKLKGSTIGITTNQAGTFSLKVPDDSGVLLFSYIGFVAQEVPLAGRRSIVVKLVEESRSLNEVVIVGYGSQKRTTVTAAISSVPMKEIKDMAVSNVATALQGRIPGVIIQQTNGTPGSNPAIKVRGLGSVSANNSPLIVLDGNIVSSSVFSMLSSDEIDRIDVLKDASSAAIYGSKGSNGVLMVTTKRGKAGKTSISADVYGGFQDVSKKIDLLNSQQFAEFSREASNTAYLDNVPGASASDPNNVRPSSYLRYRYPRGDLYDWFNFDDPQKVAALPYHDYQDMIFRRAMINNYQLTGSGGSDKVQFLVSGGYLNHDGIINTSSFDRYSVRTNLDINVSDKLKFGVGLNPSYITQNEVRANGHWADNAVINSALSAVPMAPIYTDDGTAYSSQTALAAPYNWPGITNPIANITEYHSKLNTTNLLANAFGEYAFLENLKYRISGNINFNGNRRNLFRTSRMPLNQLLPPNAATGTAYSDQSISLLFNQTFTYHTVWNAVHDLDLLAGMEATKYNTESSSATGSAYANDLVETLNASANGATTTATSSKAENSSVSYFLRAGYTYKNKYLLNMSVRWDGSSIFGQENRWGAFPAASIGWRLNEEPFMKGVPQISEAKIRISYGLSGNNSFPNNNYYPYFATLSSDNYTFNNNLANGMAPASLENVNLGWEKSDQFDAGVDVGLFNDRIYLVVDYYRRITKDLLLSVNIPSLTGFTSAYKNIGRMQNKGWEFSLNTHNLTGRFKWDTGLNLSLNRNKVLALGPTGDPILSSSGIGETNITVIGDPIGNFYGYRQLGIFKDANDLNSYPHDATSHPGDAKYEDVNNDGQITAADRTIIGNNQPDFIFSITNALSFKNFDLSIALQGTRGGEILNLSRRFFENLEGNANQMATVLNRWKSENDPGDGKTPRANERTTGNNGAVSSRWIEDGSFLRIQNVSIGYQLPKSLLNKVKVQRARIFLSGQNLYTWTNYLNYNPEVSNYEGALTGGVDYGAYPLARTFSLGLNVGF